MTPASVCFFWKHVEASKLLWPTVHSCVFRKVCGQFDYWRVLDQHALGGEILTHVKKVQCISNGGVCVRIDQ